LWIKDKKMTDNSNFKQFIIKLNSIIMIIVINC